jgi:hypothetical protein
VGLGHFEGGRRDLLGGVGGDELDESRLERVGGVKMKCGTWRLDGEGLVGMEGWMEWMEWSAQVE